MSSDTLQAMGMTGWEQMRGDKLVAPAWLAGLANDAKVEAFASKELSQFVTPKLGIRGAREVILDMTGKQTRSSTTPLQSGIHQLIVRLLLSVSLLACKQHCVLSVLSPH